MSEIITSNGLLAAIIFFLVFLLQQISVVLVRRFNKDKIEDIHRYFYNSLATPERRKKIIILLIVGPLSIYLLSLLAGDGDIIFTAYLGASLSVFVNIVVVFSYFSDPKKYHQSPKSVKATALRLLA